MKKRNHLNYIITAALIAAIYAGITLLIAPLSYGPVQLRVSEVLTILPIFTSAAIPGLTIGCLIANIASFNLIDMVFGTLASLIAAILTYYLKGIKFKGIPLLAMFPPVIVNAVIIGLEIAILYLPGEPSIWGFIISALQVGAGQLVACYVLGIPLYIALNKYNVFQKIGIKNKL